MQIASGQWKIMIDGEKQRGSQLLHVTADRVTPGRLHTSIPLTQHLDEFTFQRVCAHGIRSADNFPIDSNISQTLRNALNHLSPFVSQRTLHFRDLPSQHGRLHELFFRIRPTRQLIPFVRKLFIPAVLCRQKSIGTMADCSICQGRMPSGNKNTIEHAQLVVADLRELARSGEAILSLHALDELGFTLALVEVSREGGKGGAEGIWGGLFAQGGGKGYFMASIQEALQGLGELHEEVAGGLLDGVTLGADVVEWEGRSVGHYDQDFFGRHGGDS
ncbi:unnamed protein product [Periconia digitata]|uniref:Uncharacterized protein n=1 Tax=Periconia digitata TaxID=1303443 RepID=A0A9W4XVC9_9PLEO|nr:unnamed protein product [Periconia digitata]